MSDQGVDTIPPNKDDLFRGYGYTPHFVEGDEPELLRDHRAALRLYQTAYQAVLCDEAQDVCAEDTVSAPGSTIE